MTPPPHTGLTGAGVTVQWVSTGGVQVCPSLHPGHSQGSKHVETMVSTSDLGKTQEKVGVAGNRFCSNIIVHVTM